MIGVLTFHFAHNYGAVLQAYGLSCFLNNNNIDAEIINYRPEKMVAFYSMNLRKTKIYKLPIKFLKNMRRKKQALLFEKFIEDRLPCTGEISKEMLSEFSEKYDGVIVGSDQVWNVDITGNDSAYFLDFCGENVKRIGYAVSIGNPKSVEELEKNIRENVNAFYRLSMRESTGAQRVFDLMGKKPEVVCDPVMLLDKSVWEKMIKRPEGFNEDKYIFYYSLIEDKELNEKTLYLAKKHDLKIISVHPICTKASINCINMKNVGPEEFLWLICNAEYVCSNSFHATAFSCIFQKKAMIIPNYKSSDRSQQLLNLVKPIKSEDIFDFSQCEEVALSGIIEESKRYLLNLKSII